MKYLLDTCVVSELTRQAPDKNVISWISSAAEEQLYLSVFTIGEIRKGIEKLASGQRRDILEEWISTDLLFRFEDRILDFTVEISQTWGGIQGRAEKMGKSLSLIDGFIASIALYHDMTLVTRNEKDFVHSGAAVLNPFLSCCTK